MRAPVYLFATHNHFVKLNSTNLSNLNLEQILWTSQNSFEVLLTNCLHDIHFPRFFMKEE